ncbi:hypothetical protein Droror1_Dr00002366 [Drosera rotundifolia]
MNRLMKAPFPDLLPLPPISFIRFPFGRQSSRARLNDYRDSKTVVGIIDVNLTDGYSNGGSVAVQGEVSGGDVEEVDELPEATKEVFRGATSQGCEGVCCRRGGPSI